MNPLSGISFELPFSIWDTIMGFYYRIPENAKWIWIIIFVTVILIVLLWFITLIARQVSERKERQSEFIAREVKESIYPFLFSDDDFNQGVPYQLLNTRFKRKVVTRTLLKLDRELLGEVKHKLKAVYHQFNLIKDSRSKVASSKWHKKVQGIQEVSQMEVDNAMEVIIPYLNNQHSILRKEAQLAFLKMKGFDGLKILNDFPFTLSPWQQLVWLEAIQQFKTEPKFEFETWLNSDNDSVVSFSLKLIRVFNRSEQIESILPLLKHHNELVRKEAIEVIGETGAFQARDSFFETLNQKEETSENKVAIIKTFKNIGLPEDVEKFLGLINEEGNHYVNLELFKSAYELSGQDGSIFDELLKEHPFFQPYFDHVLDPLNS